ncbi:MAG: flagellar export chaperone FlgN [Syntrophomonadaceae bacterium]|nr:flagellar export chaperone FlgN [Syntrophomonadaceae bacterium]
MGNTKISEIIDNFDRQYQLYMDMARLSREQLDLLEEKNKKFVCEDLHDLLAKRQGLMEDIGRLSVRSRELQQKISGELNIDKFVLSKVQGKIGEDQYRKLESAVLKLEEVLKFIDRTDKRNLQLMQQKMAACNMRR